MPIHRDALCAFSMPTKPLSAALWLHWTYVVDWLAILFSWLVLSMLAFVTDHPYRRYNPNPYPQLNAEYPLNFPNKDQTVPNWALITVSFVVPVIFFSFNQIIYGSLHDFHHACLGLIESFTLLSWPVVLMKMYSGRERPTFYLDMINGEESYARSSYPSSHAAISWCGFFYLSLYLMGKFGVYRNLDQGGGDGQFYKILLCLFPCVISLSIAMQDTRDYAANFSDVNMGIFLGVSCATLGYFLNFPSLFVPHAGTPTARYFDVETVSHDAEQTVEVEGASAIPSRSPHADIEMRNIAEETISYPVE